MFSNASYKQIKKIRKEINFTNYREGIILENLR